MAEANVYLNYVKYYAFLGLIVALL